MFHQRSVAGWLTRLVIETPTVSPSLVQAGWRAQNAKKTRRPAMRLGYSCRACSRPLQASEGCSMCRDLKRIIVVTGEEEVSPLDAVQYNVRLLNTQLRDYDRAMASAKDPDTREACREAVRQVASKLSQLADAHRKLAEKRQEAVEAMTLAEQKVLFAEWFRSLTPKHRQEVVAALASSEAEMNMASNAGWRNQLA